MRSSVPRGFSACRASTNPYHCRRRRQGSLLKTSVSSVLGFCTSDRQGRQARRAAQRASEFGSRVPDGRTFWKITEGKLRPKPPRCPREGHRQQNAKSSLRHRQVVPSWWRELPCSDRPLRRCVVTVWLDIRVFDLATADPRRPAGFIDAVVVTSDGSVSATNLPKVLGAPGRLTNET